MNTGIQTYIFDLDGTLYNFGGDKFSNSRLGIKTREGFYRIIKSRNLGDPQKVYDAMLEKEWQEKIGTSQQLAEIIGKTRSEVLTEIWGNINPSEVIENISYSKKVIPALKEMGKGIFLVTAAPNVWAVNALTYMELDGYFEQILTLEDYGSSKKEAFTRIQNYVGISPSKIISVGDQEHSDILPAQELGMQALHVKGPHDLISLL